MSEKISLDSSVYQYIIPNMRKPILLHPLLSENLKIH